MLKIAIFYTGLVRTLESTIPYIINFLNNKNYLLNHEFSFFCSFQSDNDNEKMYINKLLHNNFENKIKNITWIDRNDATWCDLSNKLVDNIHIDAWWKNYLKTSGSMIEYYQMYNSYLNMKKYEEENNISYDYILRLRTDVVLKDEINFNVENITNNEIEQILKYAQEKLNKNTFINIDVFNYFMNTFMIPNRLSYDINKFSISPINENIYNNIFTVLDEINTTLIDETDKENKFIEILFNYIQKSDYLITLRNNVVYFGKAKVFEKIHKLGITYGFYKIIEEPVYWFNSESQLTGICRENNIGYYSSVSQLEDNSLYNYNATNYFDNNTLLEDQYSFFIKRN